MEQSQFKNGIKVRYSGEESKANRNKRKKLSLQNCINPFVNNGAVLIQKWMSPFQISRHSDTVPQKWSNSWSSWNSLFQIFKGKTKQKLYNRSVNNGRIQMQSGQYFKTGVKRYLYQS